MKRFYNEVSIHTVRPELVEGSSFLQSGGKEGEGFDRLSPNGGWFGILLDARPVKTPAKAPLALPNAALAEAVAEEWRVQGDDILPATMPLTGLANAAIDRVAPDPASFAQNLAVYAENELLCYRAEAPPDLVAHEAANWNPILDWAQTRYDVSFTLVNGIVHRPQPPATLARLGAAIAAYAPFALAALSPIVTIAGSLVIALAVAEQRLAPESAFDAAHLDELWQEQQWGADDFALEARAARRADFMAAARLLSMLRASA